MFTSRSLSAVPLPQFVYLGIVTSIECNHKQVDSARKGQEVCVKIENVPGETPKLYGRHFDETDMLISKVSTGTGLAFGGGIMDVGAHTCDGDSCRDDVGNIDQQQRQQQQHHQLFLPFRFL